MKALLKASAGVGALCASATIAFADCGIEKGSVRILSNDFEALHVVASAAEECASPTVEVTKNQTTEHKKIQVPALSTNPATYTAAVVANNSIMPLLNDGLIRPLDDYVAKWGQDLQEHQLIRIDGKIMAIAFMANAQHLVFRKDILERAGIEVPTTYEEVLAAAEVIREKGIMENPLAATMKPGWDLAQEFVNMYTGFNGEFFEPGTPNLIENEQGVQALAMMKALTEYMNPDFVTWDTNAIKPIWEGDEAALANSWGGRVWALIDPKSPVPEIASMTGITGTPTVGGGSIPATTLWWDGFTVAKNISDEDAEASFRAMVHGIRPEVAAENPEVTAWLVEGYQPTPAAVGVFETIKAKAKPYPMTPYMGLLHAALGNELGEFMQGRETAEQALADVTQAYNVSARDSGFLN
jgi:ABC-type glycerol-3-phosphate transport system substrate-binding protein